MRQNRGQVAGALNGRARSHADVDPHLVGDDMRQRSLAQSGGAIEQDVIDGFLARLCGFDDDLQVLADAILPDDIAQPFRPQRDIVAFVTLNFSAHQSSVFRHPGCSRFG